MDRIERKILIGKKDIKKRVKELAREISFDYKGKNPLFVGILKGSFIFLADLVRELDPEILPQIDFIAISSYGSGTTSSRDPKWEKDLSRPIAGRNIVLVEDIVDTGYSFDAVTRMLRSKNPGSIKTCALISKPDRREIEVNIDYLGFTIENKWIEGYGLDTNEDFRNLPDIWYRKV